MTSATLDHVRAPSWSPTDAQSFAFANTTSTAPGPCFSTRSAARVRILASLVTPYQPGAVAERSGGVH